MKNSVSGCFRLITIIEVKLVRSKHATPTFSCQSLVRQDLDLINIGGLFGLVTFQTDGHAILHQNGVWYQVSFFKIKTFWWILCANAINQQLIRKDHKTCIFFFLGNHFELPLSCKSLIGFHITISQYFRQLFWVAFNCNRVIGFNITWSHTGIGTELLIKVWLWIN